MTEYRTIAVTPEQKKKFEDSRPVALQSLNAGDWLAFLVDHYENDAREPEGR